MARGYIHGLRDGDTVGIAMLPIQVLTVQRGLTLHLLNQWIVNALDAPERRPEALRVQTKRLWHRHPRRILPKPQEVSDDVVTLEAQVKRDKERSEHRIVERDLAQDIPNEFE